jgi:hypothetical protein
MFSQLISEKFSCDAGVGIRPTAQLRPDVMGCDEPPGEKAEGDDTANWASWFPRNDRYCHVPVAQQVTRQFLVPSEM